MHRFRGSFVPETSNMGHDATAYGGHTTALEPLLDVVGTAKTLDTSVRTIYRLVAAGELTPTRVGSRLRFEPDELRRYIERQRLGAAP